MGNRQCKNNIRLKNVKEHAEGPNLQAYIVESITSEEAVGKKN